MFESCVGRKPRRITKLYMNDEVVSLLEKQCDFLSDISSTLDSLKTHFDMFSGYGFDSISDHERPVISPTDSIG